MILVEVDAMMVLAARIAPTAGVFPMLPDSAMPVRNVSSQFSCLLL